MLLPFLELSFISCLPLYDEAPSVRFPILELSGVHWILFSVTFRLLTYFPEAEIINYFKNFSSILKNVRNEELIELLSLFQPKFIISEILFIQWNELFVKCILQK